VKFGVFASHGQHEEPITVKSGTKEHIIGSLFTLRYPLIG